MAELFLQCHVTNNSKCHGVFFFARGLYQVSAVDMLACLASPLVFKDHGDYLGYS